jgi:hypothetical protein
LLGVVDGLGEQELVIGPVCDLSLLGRELQVQIADRDVVPIRLIERGTAGNRTLHPRDVGIVKRRTPERVDRTDVLLRHVATSWYQGRVSVTLTGWSAIELPERSRWRTR